MSDCRCCVNPIEWWVLSSTATTQLFISFWLLFHALVWSSWPLPYEKTCHDLCVCLMTSLLAGRKGDAAATDALTSRARFNWFESDNISCTCPPLSKQFFTASSFGSSRKTTKKISSMNSFLLPKLFATTISTFVIGWRKNWIESAQLICMFSVGRTHIIFQTTRADDGRPAGRYTLSEWNRTAGDLVGARSHPSKRVRFRLLRPLIFFEGWLDRSWTTQLSLAMGFHLITRGCISIGDARYIRETFDYYYY